MPLDGRGFPIEPIEPEVKLAIENARHYLELGGFVRGAAHGARGQFCSWSAIREATHGWDGNPLYVRTLDRVVTFLPPTPFDAQMTPMGKLQHWNDQPGRTIEEVLDLFDRTRDEP